MKNYIFPILFVLAVGFIVYQYFGDSDLKEKNQELENYKKEVAIEIERFQKERDSVIEYSRIKTDSLINLEQQIKYIRYERFSYIDRDLDTALDSITEYRYDSRTGSEN